MLSKFSNHLSSSSNWNSANLLLTSKQKVALKSFARQHEFRYFLTKSEGPEVKDKVTSPTTSATTQTPTGSPTSAATPDRKLITPTKESTTATAATNSITAAKVSTPPPKPAEVAASTSSADVAKQSQQAIKDVKRAIRANPPRFMGLWYLFGIVGLAVSTMYYLNEQDRHERKVEHVIKMLQSADPDVRREGMEQLDSCLFFPKRLLATYTEIPQSKKFLVESGLVETLLHTFAIDDDKLKEGASVWLTRLSNEFDARKRILNFGLDPILKTISSSESNITLWLAASSVLLSLAKHSDAIPMMCTAELRDIIDSMHKSGHPLGPLIAAQIESSLRTNDAGQALFEGGRTDAELAVLTNKPSAAAVRSAIGAVVPPEPAPQNPPDAWLRGDYGALAPPIAWGLFASFWGGLQWRRAGLTGGLGFSDARKFATKQNKTGRYVFFFLMLDPITQIVMAWPEKGIKFPLIDEPVKIPQKPFGYSLSTVAPITETALFIGSGLFALRYQRYVLVPMAAAMTSAHWDEIQEHTKPYQEMLGIKEDPVKTVVSCVRSFVMDKINQIQEGNK